MLLRAFMKSTCLDDLKIPFPPQYLVKYSMNSSPDFLPLMLGKYIYGGFILLFFSPLRL